MKLHLSWRRLAESLAWRLFPYAQLQLRLKSSLVVPVATKSEMATFRELFLEQQYDELLDRLPPPRTVLDLGCNCGYFPLVLHHRARLRGDDPVPIRCVLVDADPAMVARAREVLGLNGLASNAAFVAGLVGARGQTATFHISREGATSSAVVRPSRSRPVRMASVDLEQVLQEHFGGRVDLLKCDIEGAEDHLVRDWHPVLAAADAVILEWHGFGIRWPEFADTMRAAGFLPTAERPAKGEFRIVLFQPSPAARTSGPG